jgi:hypothetical protein
MTDEDGNQSIREMAEADGAAADATELFPMGSLDGDEGSLDTMIQPGESVQYTVSMNATSEVPAPRGGMLDIRKEHLLLVTCEVAHPIPVPVREGDRATGKTITGWKIRQQLRPIYVERVKGEAGAIEAAFADLLRADEDGAAALLDRMRARMESALGAPA